MTLDIIHEAAALGAIVSFITVLLILVGAV